MNNLASVLLFSFALILTSCNTVPDPIDVVQLALSNEFALDKEEYFVEGYLGYLNQDGACFPENIDLKFKLLRPLWKTDSLAVVNMTVRDTNGGTRGYDSYIYLTRESGHWKIEDCKAFSPDSPKCIILEEVAEEESFALRRYKLHKKLDKLLEQGYLEATEEGSKFEKGNAQLLYSLDDELVSYFKKRKKEFEALRLAFTNTCASKGKRLQDLDASHDVKRRLKELYLQDIEVQSFYTIDGKTNYNLEFIIAEKLYFNRKLGFMHAEVGGAVPEIDPDKVMMLRYLGDDWFLYKTNG